MNFSALVWSIQVGVIDRQGVYYAASTISKHTPTSLKANSDNTLSHFAPSPWIVPLELALMATAWI